MRKWICLIARAIFFFKVVLLLVLVGVVGCLRAGECLAADMTVAVADWLMNLGCRDSKDGGRSTDGTWCSTLLS